MKTNIDEPCAGNLQARFFRGSCSNKTQTRGVKLQLLPNNEIDFINANHPLNLEQEFGNGYIKLTDGSFNEYTGHYQIGSEILDESHNMIGDLTIDGYIHSFHADTHNMNLKSFTEIDLKGDIKKINSLYKKI
ncbi:MULTISPECIES: hypothetical protein [unclassified Wolbachia]|uniref:hypothetical protein n=1 Tax=unclassified Wolbachia TaxID=2640676 RepID=UPI0022279854|nr:MULTISPECIES: hypothetical protein [unclassified Wolbachia]